MNIEQADQYLAACVRAVLSNQTAPPWPEAFAAAEQGEAVALRASFHGIAVLLGQSPSTLESWPAPAADTVLSEMRLAGLWEELHRTLITGVMRQLAQNGIAAILLKGTALAYLFYADPAARRRGDTDLLVRPADLERTRAVLAQAGCYRREDPHGLFFQETWLIDYGAHLEHSIDLHWEPSDRPVLQKTLRAGAFWRQPVPIPRLSPNAVAPDPVMMVVHGAFNQAWHLARGYLLDSDRVVGGRRLIWAVDYFNLTRAFSATQWEELAGFCEMHDAAAVVHAALDGARQDIELAVPAAIMGRLSRAAKGSITHAYIHKPGVVREFLSDMRAAEGLAMRLRLLQSFLFAPRSHLVLKYPEASHWPTALLQLRRYSAALGRRRRPWETGR
jgi:hypothetical protein